MERDSSAALRRFGLDDTPAEYVEAMTLLRGAFVSPPAIYERPVVKQRHGGQFDDPGYAGMLFKESRIVTEELDKMKHVELAANVTQPSMGRAGRLLPTDLQQAVVFVLKKGAKIRRWRAEQQLVLARASDMLTPLSAKLHKHADVSRPSTVKMIAGRVHVALIAAMSDALSWPDANLARGFAYGFPVLGDIPDSGLFRPVEDKRSDECFMGEYKAVVDSNDEWNRSLVVSLRMKAQEAMKTKRDWMLRDLESSTKKEVNDRLMERGVPLAQMDKRFGKGNWRALVRFPVPQGAKVRSCDDGKKSLHNTATLVHETITLPTFEFPSRVAALVAEKCRELSLPFPALTIATDDIQSAYRMVPTSQPQFTVCALFCFEEDEVLFFGVPGHNFGLLSAVINFNRVPALFTAFSRAFFALWLKDYFDDNFLTDTETAKESGREALHALYNAAVFPLHPGKRVRPMSVARVLGVMCDLSAFQSHLEVRFYPAPGRVEECLRLLDVIEDNGRLYPASARVLVGKLGFTLSAAYGRVGRAALQPVFAAQEVNQGLEVSGSLLATMTFFRTILPALPVRVKSLSIQAVKPEFILYTDASEDSVFRGLGVVLFILNGDGATRSIHYAAEQCPKWIYDSFIGESKKAINQLELLVAVLAYRTFPETRGMTGIHFIDNTSALSGLLHGYSSRPEMARLCNMFHIQALVSRAMIWYEWVPSLANIADIPSRPEFAANGVYQWALMDSLGAIRRSLFFPNSSEWEDPFVWMASCKAVWPETQ